jgi:hypothetical protein
MVPMVVVSVTSPPGTGAPAAFFVTTVTNADPLQLSWLGEIATVTVDICGVVVTVGLTVAVVVGVELW